MEEKIKVTRKTHKKVSTVETRSAILELCYPDEKRKFVQHDDFTIIEFDNRAEAKEYFVEKFGATPNMKGVIFVKDEELEFIHKVPKLKATKG